MRALFAIFLVAASAHAGAPPQAPPVDPRFDARLENIETRLSNIEDKIDALADDVSESRCQCENDKPKAKESVQMPRGATPAISVPSVPDLFRSESRMVCGPNGCTLQRPSVSQSYSPQSASQTIIHSRVYKRGLFGKWRRVK